MSETLAKPQHLADIPVLKAARAEAERTYNHVSSLNISVLHPLWGRRGRAFGVMLAIDALVRDLEGHHVID